MTESVKDGSSRKQKLDIKNSRILPFIGLLFVIVLFSILTKGQILSLSNLQTIFNSALIVAMISTGAIFVYSGGDIDLSIGAVLGFANMIGMMVALATGNWFLILITEIAVCMVFTNVNSLIQSTMGIAPFISSLCLQYIARSSVQIILRTRSLSLPIELYWMDSWGIKIGLFVLVVILTLYYFNYTELGKYNCAIGGNRQAAQQGGVKVKLYRQMSYLFLGLVMGMATFVYSGHNVTVKASTGQGMELDIIFALVLGGMPLSGGYGSRAYCGFIGAFTVIFLKYGLQLLGIASSYAQGLVGVLFLIVVYLRYDREVSGVYN